MGGRVINYGYIINKDLHKCLDTDVYWNFTRYNKKGEPIIYNGIESVLDYSNDTNIVMKGNSVEFIEWRDESPPPEEEETEI